MRRKGVKLLSTGVLINAIVAEIDAEQEANGAKNGQSRNANESKKGPQAFAEEHVSDD